jgi:SAM-dependent methyltransferase
MSGMRAGRACRACGSIASETLVASERMFNLGGTFEYLRCGHCGSLSLAAVPSDLGRFYPESYHATTQQPAAHAAGLSSRIDAAYDWLLGYWRFDLDAIRRLLPERTSSILDVGAGGGGALESLVQAGYRNVMGVDPMLPESFERSEPFPMKRCGVVDSGRRWDLIMYHHVMEHIADPVSEFRQAAAQLNDGGYLLIRVPVADSWAFRRYGTHWVQLDPPRHLWVPTRKTLIRVGAESGLTLHSMHDDSTAFQLWASRLYQKGSLSLRDAPVWTAGPRRKLLNMPRLIAEALFAMWLNLIRRGDQCRFIFAKTAGGSGS